MASDILHAPRERLRGTTIALHQAITSLTEELEAIDWYQQRADDCDDGALREILLHNMREEMEHASMLLEWIRRHSPDFEAPLRQYLFTTGAVTGIEAEAKDEDEAGPPPTRPGFTVGRLK